MENIIRTELHDDVVEGYYIASPKIARALERIEESILHHFKNVKNSEVTFFFTTIGGVIISGKSKTHPDLVNRCIEEISHEVILDLEEAFYLEEIGSFLHFTLYYSQKRNSFSISINRMRRFNILEDQWKDNDDVPNIFPKRASLLHHFKKYPRSKKYIPEWYDLLNEESRVIKEKLDSIDTKVFYFDRLKKLNIPKKYSILKNNELFIKIWNYIDILYSNSLYEDKELLSFLLDSEKESDLPGYLSHEFEPELISNSIDYFNLWSSAEDRAVIVNYYLLSIGEKVKYPIYDNSGYQDEEIDYFDLDEDFADLITNLVRHFTRKRFPDLENIENV